MVHITRQFPVRVQPARAVSYLSDFANAEAWDPGTVRCTQMSDGPVQVGTRWHNVSKLIVINTELDYELAELREDGVVFVGRNKTATSVDTIDVLPHAGGCRITYDARVTFNGAARYADPLMHLVFLKLGHDLVRDMTSALEAL